MKDSIDTINELLKKRNECLSANIEFPRYKKLPDSVNLAMQILKEHGMKIVISVDSLP